MRLPRYDYSSPGVYFITICTAERLPIFGSIAEDQVDLSEVGVIVESEWRRTPELRPDVALDEYVIMPNHLHAVVFIGTAANGPGKTVHRALLRRDVSTYAQPAAPAGTLRSPSRTLGAFIRGFKAITTARVNRLRGTPEAPVWQRNYYDHVIRDEDELIRVRQYIADNPTKWALDRLNPDCPLRR